MWCGILKCQWDTTPSLKLLDPCVNKLESLATNHSLRVTSATHLFQSAVDEQLIMLHTGHRSIDGVRSYKRVSEEQKRAVSGILSSTCTKINTKPAQSDHPESPKRMKVDEEQENNIKLYQSLHKQTQT